MNYDLVASNLTNNVTVTAPSTQYEVSLLATSGFASSVVVTHTDGAIDQTIFVQFTPTAQTTYSGNVTNVSSGATTQNVAVTGTGVGAVATLGTTVSTINFPDTKVGNTSMGMSYSVIGNNITGDITVTCPTGFKVGTDLFGTFLSTMTFTPPSSDFSKRVYVKFYPTLETTYSGNITNSCSGATSKIVAVTGTGVVPTISVSPSFYEFGDVQVGSSAEGSYNLIGTTLTSNITITAPTDFMISETSGSGFVSSLVVVRTNGAIDKTIYVQYSPTTEGDNNAMLLHTSSGATNKNFGIYGAGIAPSIVVSTTSLAFGDTEVGNTDEDFYSLSAIYLTEDLVITAPTGYEVSLTSGSNFANSLVVSPSGTDSEVNETIYVMFAPNSSGVFNGNITNVSSGARTKNVALTGMAYESTITISDEELDFGDIIVGQTEILTYTIEGEYLSDVIDLSVGGASGFLISDDNSTFGTSLVVTPTAGTVSPTAIYVKFSPTAETNYYNSVANECPGADFKYVSLIGTGVVSTLSITPSTINFGDVTVGGSKILACTVTGDNLTGNITAESPDNIFLFCETIDGTYALTINLTPTGGSINQDVFVKCTPITVGYYNEGLDIYSTNDGLNESLSVDFTGVNPSLTATPDVLDLGDVLFGNTSSEMTFQLTGENLIDDAVLFGSLIWGGIEISLTTGTGFTNELTIPYGNGTIDQTIYVRCSPTFSGPVVIDLEIDTYGTSTAVELNYTGLTTITVTPSTLTFGDVQVGSSEKLSYSLDCDNLITTNGDKNITVTAPAGEYQVSLTENGTYANSVVALSTSGTVAQTIWVQFSPTTEGEQTGNVSNTTDYANTVNVAVLGTGVPVGTPTITTSVSSIDFGIIQTGVSDVQTYTIEGVDLTNDITISVTGSNYEISEDGTNFGTTNIIITASG